MLRKIDKFKMEAIITMVAVGKSSKTESTVCTQVHAAPGGLIGDRHYTENQWHKTSHQERYIAPKGEDVFNTRQVSIVSQEEMTEIAEELGLGANLPGYVIGANIEILGIPQLSLLPPGTLLRSVDNGVIRVARINVPCEIAGQAVQKRFPDHPRLASRFVAAALDRRGVVGYVVHEGTFGRNEVVTAEVPRQQLYFPSSIARICALGE